ncbi:hypothetical protein [Billgrantia aerodenitrificans]|uniref:hypothetical protein n=1 Tax=Billgrantia aerodenitrificans TaxID=2733483 RepID=UPI001F21F305|nr:hypothetical protein [Halomonas aerodenitrificans]
MQETKKALGETHLQIYAQKEFAACSTKTRTRQVASGGNGQEECIRLNTASGDGSVERILAARGPENQVRRKHLLVRLAEMLLDADVYALGQKLDLNRSNLSTRLDDACQYLLENTTAR